MFATNENAVRYNRMGKSVPAAKIAVIPAPRATDALGTALRDAFMRDAGIPADMRALLAALDCRAPAAR